MRAEIPKLNVGGPLGDEGGQVRPQPDGTRGDVSPRMGSQERTVC